MTEYMRKKAAKTSYILQEVLVTHAMHNAKAKSVIKELKNAGLFSSTKRLRELLRVLHSENELKLIPQATFRIKSNEYSTKGGKQKKWFFNPTQ